MNWTEKEAAHFLKRFGLPTCVEKDCPQFDVTQRCLGCRAAASILEAMQSQARHDAEIAEGPGEDASDVAIARAIRESAGIKESE